MKWTFKILSYKNIDTKTLKHKSNDLTTGFEYLAHWLIKSKQILYKCLLDEIKQKWTG